MRLVSLLACSLCVAPLAASASESPTPIHFGDDVPPAPAPQAAPIVVPEPATAPHHAHKKADSDAADSGGDKSASQVSSRALFYEVHSPTDKTRIAYLLGSIHVGSASTYPLSNLVENAFHRATTVAVEADVRPEKARGPVERMQRNGMYPSGSIQQLKTHVPAKCYEGASKIAAKLDMSSFRLNQMKAWYASMAIESAEAQAAGLKAEWGIDLHFLGEIRGPHPDIVELEGIEGQTEMFSDMPDEQQAALLCSVVATAASFKTDVKRLYQAWHNGDAEGIKAIIDETDDQTPDMKDMLDTVLNDRNDKMAAKVAGFLDGDGTTFVIVGAAHLVGPKGIVALLKSKGFKIDQK